MARRGCRVGAHAGTWDNAVMATAQGKRALNRERMEAAILAVGTAHLARSGAASLSLRAVARDIGVAPGALYRYVADRNGLLTLLLVSSFNDIADATEAALRELADGTSAAKLEAAARAMREWALANPERWSLMYGTPVPDYEPAGPATTIAGIRVAVEVARIVAARGTVRAECEPIDISPRLRAFLEEGRMQLGLHVSSDDLILTLRIWTALIGAINAEVFGHFGKLPEEIAADMFEAQLSRLSVMVT